MNIHDYIRTHNMSLVRKLPNDDFNQSWTTDFLCEPDGDEFEIYANPDKTLIVSLNLTKQKYMIAHNEIITYCSPWTSTETKMILDPLLDE